jgi:hypothetical protein
MMATWITEKDGIKVGQDVTAKSQLGHTVKGKVAKILQGDEGAVFFVAGTRSGKVIQVREVSPC